MRSLPFVLSVSTAVLLAACGGLVDVPPADPVAAPVPVAPSAPAPTPAPVTPPLPAPAGGLVADAASAPLAVLPATSRLRATRCHDLDVGRGILPGDQQAVWEASGAGHRRLASGLLVGDHHFNTILGALGDDVFVESWSAKLDSRYGVVRISAASGVATEVQPLGAHGSVRSVVRWRDALWGVQSGALLRITGESASVVATGLDPNARVVLRTSGPVVVDASHVRAVRGDGTLGAAIAVADAGARDAWDVHPDGTVVLASGKELRRSDLAAPLLVATDAIASVRIDVATGAIAFAVKRAEPALSSLFVLEEGGVRHVLATDRHLPQGQEQPFAIFGAEGGRLDVATTCSDDADAPSTMPVRVEASTGAVAYVVDEPAYPYVVDVARMLEATWFSAETPWVDAASPRFFVRR